MMTRMTRLVRGQRRRIRAAATGRKPEGYFAEAEHFVIIFLATHPGPLTSDRHFFQVRTF